MESNPSSTPAKGFIVEDPTRDIQSYTRELQGAERQRYQRLENLKAQELRKEELKQKNIDNLYGYDASSLVESGRQFFEKERSRVSKLLSEADDLNEIRREVAKLGSTYSQLKGYRTKETDAAMGVSRDLSYAPAAEVDKYASRKYGDLYTISSIDLNPDSYAAKRTSWENPFDPNKATVSDDGTVMVEDANGQLVPFNQLPAYANPNVWDFQPEFKDVSSFGSTQAFANVAGTRTSIKSHSSTGSWSRKGSDAYFDSMLADPSQKGVQFRMALLNDLKDKVGVSEWPQEFKEDFASMNFDDMPADALDEILDGGRDLFAGFSKFERRSTSSRSSRSKPTTKQQFKDNFFEGMTVSSVGNSGGSYDEVTFSVDKLAPVLTLENEEVSLIHNNERMSGESLVLSKIDVEPDNITIAVGPNGKLAFRINSGLVKTRGKESAGSSVSLANIGTEFYLGAAGGLLGDEEFSWNANATAKDTFISDLTPGEIIIMEGDKNYRKVYSYMNERFSDKMGINFEEFISEMESKVNDKKKSGQFDTIQLDPSQETIFN
ncbi:MAG: hypothetical protein HRT61_00435 [Ekhidna sp.]|nr:hypothetical protein [Ekhidna sp.]